MGFFDKISGKEKKQEAFYASYAESKGLTRSKEMIPAVTKSLGGEAVTNERFDGQLTPEFKGTVAFVETTITTSNTVLNNEYDRQITGQVEGSSRVESSSKAYPSTVVMIPLEKVTGSLSGLAVKRNYDKQSIGKTDTYGELRRLTLDGIDLDERFYVFADENADAEKVRLLFSPAFSAWLNDRDEKFFSFEIGRGTLVTKHPKYDKDPEELDAHIAEACEIASHLETA